MIFKRDLTLYRLDVIRKDGKIVPQFNGEAVLWERVHGRMERYEAMKKYWIGEGEFPIKSLKVTTIETSKFVRCESKITDVVEKEMT